MSMRNDDRLLIGRGRHTGAGGWWNPGMPVPPADPRALAQGIIDHADNPQEAGRAGQAGRERTERLYCLEVMTRSCTEMYRGLLSFPAGRAASPTSGMRV
jgi:glycosyltransferase involved in cell wall biosynthesis